MKNIYQYFKRDISWLSFNYRVLLEADDDTLPIYERINFISIYSSNLEEFYKVRVAEHKAVVSGGETDEKSIQESTEIIRQITEEVNAQLEERIRIYEHKILPALREHNIIFYQGTHVEEFHKEFISDYFTEEIFPYLQPVPVLKEEIVSFLRDNRLYLAVRAYRNINHRLQYFVMKLPNSQEVSRFVELPKHEGKHYIMFIEDVVKANIDKMFPGYEVDCSYCLKISRDADILIDDYATGDIVEQVKKKIKKRKIGAVCRFVYDRQMPPDFLNFIARAFRINPNDFVQGDKHLSLEDLCQLPIPIKKLRINEKPQPMKLKCLEGKDSIFRYINKEELLIHFPYHTFEHIIQFLYEAVNDPFTIEIMITQYRVAENSTVINTLIAAARNGKKVTVFVELKARFDEENNLATAEMMQQAGINIIYSIPGLKVHAKVTIVLRRNHKGEPLRSYGYISTGNFNERTARIYADTGLFTSNKVIVDDLHKLFLALQKELEYPVFRRLLVARFNLIPKLTQMIRREVTLAKKGKGGKIVLKMNALQDPKMIDELYKASEAGVQIDLIIRGVCCLIPGQSYSRNIRVTRIVDSFLEHTRIWYFGNDGNPRIYLGSPDWMRRNLYRRIEAVTPVMGKEARLQIIKMLELQLADNKKAVWIDSHLRNIFKSGEGEKEVRAQYAFYNYLGGQEE